MLALQILMLALLLFPVPLLVGGIWASVDKKPARLSFMWISGQITLWAGFQLIAVVAVFMGKSFRTVCTSFTLFEIAMIFLALGSLTDRKNKKRIRHEQEENRPKTAFTEWIGWLTFAVIFAVLLVGNLFLTYADGDNAFYLATANLTVTSDTMYRIMPYTGFYMELDVRHALAPFPVWVAYLSRMSGLPVLIIAQIVMPGTMLFLFFQLAYLIANTILEDKKSYIPLFMVLSAILVLFGDYSFYTKENFLVARSAQGKAVLGNIIIPFLLWVVWKMLEYVQEKKVIPFRYYGLLQAAMLAGCLCSALSCFLLVLFLGVVSLCIFCMYRTIKPILWFAYSAVAPAVFAGIYFLS